MIGLILWVLGIVCCVNEARNIVWPAWVTRWIPYPGLIGLLIGAVTWFFGALALFIVYEVQQSKGTP